MLFDRKNSFSRYLRVVGFIVMASALLYTCLYFVDYKITGILHKEKITHENFHAYCSSMDFNYFFRVFFSIYGDNLQDNTKSTMVLYENNNVLGPAHTSHNSIREKGGGRFSHWGNVLYFSSKDNSNPTENGHHYSFNIVARPNLIIIVGMFMLSIFFVFLRHVKHVLIVLLLGIFVVTSWLFLYFNVINPFTIVGKLLLLLQLLLAIFAYATSIFILKKYFFKCSILQLVLILSFSIMWVLFGVETVFRLFPLNNTLALNPAVKYTWPDWIYYKPNSLGFRDREFQTEKSKKTFRIIAIGDSFTEGAGVARNETYVAVLENLLNQSLIKRKIVSQVEVYNMGLCGANTLEEVDLLERASKIYKPDIVILGYVLNDAEIKKSETMLTNGLTPEKRGGGGDINIVSMNALLINKMKSYAYYWLYVNYLSMVHGGAIQQYVKDHEEGSYSWELVKNSLAKLKSISLSRRFELIAVVFPLFIGVDKYPDELSVIHKKICFEFVKNNIRAYDLLPYYLGKSNALIKFAFSEDDGHPGVLGHQLAAEFLHSKIVQSPSFRTFINNSAK